MASQPDVSPVRGRKLRICRVAIEQGATRIGIQKYFEQFGWRPWYCHKDCLTENTLRQLYFEIPHPRFSGDASHVEESGEAKVKAALRRQVDKEARLAQTGL